ncbi:DUF4889 domain-containing protein, partial [Staphylococcus aureus]
RSLVGSDFFKQKTAYEIAQCLVGSEMCIRDSIKVEPSNDFKPKKGDFVKLVSKDDGKTFYKQEIVKHDDVPHGLM